MEGPEYIIETYDHLNKVLGKEIELIFVINRVGDVKHSNEEISKVEELMGYGPKGVLKRY